MSKAQLVITAMRPPSATNQPGSGRSEPPHLRQAGHDKCPRADLSKHILV